MKNVISISFQESSRTKTIRSGIWWRLELQIWGSLRSIWIHAVMLRMGKVCFYVLFKRQSKKGRLIWSLFKILSLVLVSTWTWTKLRSTESILLSLQPSTTMLESPPINLRSTETTWKDYMEPCSSCSIMTRLYTQRPAQSSARFHQKTKMVSKHIFQWKRPSFI